MSVLKMKSDYNIAILPDLLKRGFSNKSVSFFLFLAVFFCYYISHYTFLEIPTADYIGNFRPFVLRLLRWDLSGVQNKVLPVYPFLVALFTKTGLISGEDPVYATALAINAVFYPFYIFLVLKMYGRFLKERESRLFLIFLLLNTYTLYMALNAELELVMVTMILFSFYLMGRNSRFTSISVFLSALLKWDSVFIVPAYAISRWLKTRKVVSFILAGIVSGSGIVLWVLFFALRGMSSGEKNTYIEEIARRGPNVYRFFGDSLLVMSGFLQWLGIDVYNGYQNGITVLPVIQGMMLVVLGGLVIYSLYKGIGLWSCNRDVLKWPVIVYIVGYLLVHIVYQNTKARYVFPILWFLNLLMLYGGREIFGSMLISTEKGCRRIKVLNTSIACIFFIFSLMTLFNTGGQRGAVVVWIVLFSAALLFFVFSNYSVGSLLNRIVIVMLVFSFVSMNLVYSRKIFEHYSKRRIEFKHAALYFRDIRKPGEKLLISESNVAVYVTALERKAFMRTASVEGDDSQQFLKNAKKRGADFLYIDDFYIRRLQLNDKNALEKRANFLKEIRDNPAGFEGLELLRVIEVGSSINGYFYRLQ
ncbi:MAG: hypothetical protein PF637_01240 [Spirochaetes bacterium]|nr:hypothetical protein [Spirochaetota bacterium]